MNVGIKKRKKRIMFPSRDKEAENKFAEVLNHTKADALTVLIYEISLYIATAVLSL